MAGWKTHRQTGCLTIRAAVPTEEYLGRAIPPATESTKPSQRSMRERLPVAERREFAGPITA